MIKFTINPQKVIEAIVYLSSKEPNIDHYHVVKTIFYADKSHLNKYGRPVLGDTYIKMPAGPVPSYVLDVINLNSLQVAPEVLDHVLASMVITQEGKRKLISPKRPPNLSEFSDSDIECLDAAFDACIKKTFEELFDETHEEKAWKKADLNGQMDYLLMLDVNNPFACDIAEDLKECSRHMVI